jgi:hypothetical protein
MDFPYSLFVVEEKRLMQHIAPQVVSIADACLGGLQGRSALLIGPEEQRFPFVALLRRAGMKRIYQEDTPLHAAALLPSVQLLISMPRPRKLGNTDYQVPVLTAAMVAKGCISRHTPLLIFDLACSPSVEELAGLLPPVCLYTPEDVRHILQNEERNPTGLAVVAQPRAAHAS